MSQDPCQGHAYINGNYAACTLQRGHDGNCQYERLPSTATPAKDSKPLIKVKPR